MSDQQKLTYEIVIIHRHVKGTLLKQKKLAFGTFFLFSGVQHVLAH